MVPTTDRLRLRPWRAADAERVLDLYGRLEVVRWLGEGPPRVMGDLSAAHAAIQRWRARSATPPLGSWAAEVTATGVVAGQVLLALLPHRPGEDAEIEVAWHFHPDSWGHGYATEAASAVLAHAFSQGLPRVWALTHRDNTASQRVCARLGLRHLGQEQAWYDVPMEVYAQTAQEYAGRT